MYQNWLKKRQKWFKKMLQNNCRKMRFIADKTCFKITIMDPFLWVQFPAKALRVGTRVYFPEWVSN